MTGADNMRYTCVRIVKKEVAGYVQMYSCTRIVQEKQCHPILAYKITGLWLNVSCRMHNYLIILLTSIHAVGAWRLLYLELCKWNQESISRTTLKYLIPCSVWTSPLFGTISKSSILYLVVRVQWSFIEVNSSEHACGQFPLVKLHICSPTWSLRCISNRGICASAFSVLIEILGSAITIALHAVFADILAPDF